LDFYEGESTMQSTHSSYPFRLAFVATALSVLLLAACVPLETAEYAAGPQTIMPQVFILQSNHILESSKSESAIATYTQAIWLEPTNAEAYLQRAEAHYEQGDYELALADVDKAFALNPWDPFVYALRCKVYQALEQHDAARKDWERAVQ
jgi:tetratricopeptide (TPR) repeat protein